MRLTENTVLLIIDVQNHFDDPKLGHRNNPFAEIRMASILEKWRELEWPVIHVQHISDPSKPHHLGREIKDEVKPLNTELVITKSVNNAFIGTKLEKILREMNCSEIVIIGLTTDHCVSTTTRMAANLGFSPIVISDATATFERISYDGKFYKAEEIHCLALVQLHKEFAQVIKTNELLESIVPKSMYESE